MRNEEPPEKRQRIENTASQPYLSIRFLTNSQDSPQFASTIPAMNIASPMIQKDSSPINCSKCNTPLSSEKRNVNFKQKYYHADCFRCTTCSEPLDSSFFEDNDNPYCKRDYAKLREKNIQIPSDVTFSVGTQPAEYQIANYNVHPSPTVVVSSPLPDNITIYAYLVEEDKQIFGGFQGGDVKMMKAGLTQVTFTGLKLNKIGPIKNELNLKASQQLNKRFFILFKVSDRTILSQPFKLVSSCNQVPKELRDQVRPKKPSSTSSNSGKSTTES